MTQTGGREDVVARLSEEVGRLGSRLQQIGAELQALALVGTPPLAPAPSAGWWNPLGPPSAVPSAPVGPVARPFPLAGPAPVAGPAVGPGPAWGPAWAPGPGWTPPPRVHWWQREGAASRAVAVAGSAVTLIGVVMLLVLAAQGGWFGPVPRVVGGAVLALGLVGLALRVHRRENGRAGAVALAGTGAAGLYLDVVAATALYGWLPAPVGLAVGAAVAAGGLALAHRWSSQSLAVVVVAGAAVLSPVLVEPGRLLLVAFLLALQVGSAGAAALAARERTWPALAVVRIVPPVLAALGAVAAAPDDATGRLLVVLTCLLVTATGLGLALVDLRRRPTDVVATGSLALAVSPSLVAAGLLEQWAAVAVAGGLAAVLVVLVVTGGALVGRARGTLVALAAVALFQATATAVSADSAAAALLVEGLLLTALAHRVRSRVVLLTAAVYGALGALALAVRLPASALVSAGGALSDATAATVLGAVLLVAAVVALAAEVRWSHVVAHPQPLCWIGAVVALYGSTAALVAGSVLALDRPGFVVGHSAATVVWVAAGLVLLARGPARGGPLEARAAGLLLVAAAVAKLLLFDLSALDGVARVAAFLVTGLLLLWRGALARSADAKPGRRGH
jgi:uncharacterized membrane protein